MTEGAQGETQEELMERVKKMSPKELQEFQKSRCIFCQIIEGKVQSKKIYSDDKVIAILDINPGNPGHVLIMPKEHYAIMPQVPEEVIGHMAIVAKRISQIALKALGAKGTNIIVQNGIAAGQKAQHFMLHVIPRKENDGIKFLLEKKTVSEKDYNTVMERVKKRVNELFNIKEEIEEFIKEEIADEKKEEEIKEADFKDVEDADREIENLNEDIENLQEEVEYVKEENERFITSPTAKRYHKKNCAFAQNIPIEKRIILTEEEADLEGKKPCTCVTGKRIPLRKDETGSENKVLDEQTAKNEEQEKEENNMQKDNIKEETKQENDDDMEKVPEHDDHDDSDKSANLDDIARLIGG
jgi:histidine triad (HIT) family protein